MSLDIREAAPVTAPTPLPTPPPVTCANPPCGDGSSESDDDGDPAPEDEIKELFSDIEVDDPTPPPVYIPVYSPSCMSNCGIRINDDTPTSGPTLEEFMLEKHLFDEGTPEVLVGCTPQDTLPANYVCV